MNCSFCGCFSSNEHLQYDLCNASMKGYCVVCKAMTKFIQTNACSPKSTIEQQSSRKRPNVFSKEQSTHSAFPKELVEEIENQSRLSKEHLSMNDSNTQTTDNRVGAQQALPIENNYEYRNTLFTNCIGHLDNHHQDIGKNLNAASFSGEYKNVRNENIFLFQEDPSDANVIDTSEIRFMNSTESFHNIFTNSKPNELATASRSSQNDEQRKTLSTKVLQDFDSRNSVNSREVVNNYLQTYSPARNCQSPAYNCQYPDCHFIRQPGQQKLEITMKTVSLSTESDPRLESTCLDASEGNLDAKSPPCDYLIMQAVGISPVVDSATMIVEKHNHKSNLDIRMQKILETLTEDAKIPKFTEKSHLIKIPTEIPAKEQEKEQTEIRNLKKKDKSSDAVGQLLNAYRGFYNPPNPLIVPVNNLHLLSQPQPVQQEPPPPQFQTIPCSCSLAQELLKQVKFLNVRPVPVCMLNIPRSPIHCPESTCQRMIFVSDFNKHLVVDHSHLPMERIAPFQCKNFFLDTRLTHCGTSKCHLLYLMRDKIIGLGSSEYKDFLPILVMTTRMSLNQMCGLVNPTSTLEYYLIWVTGIAPEGFPISVSLTVWSRSGRIPSCHVVYSGQMYSIRNSQSALDVWQSGRMLLLSPQEIDALTRNGKEMLNLQISVH